MGSAPLPPPPLARPSQPIRLYASYNAPRSGYGGGGGYPPMMPYFRPPRPPFPGRGFDGDYDDDSGSGGITGMLSSATERVTDMVGSLTGANAVSGGGDSMFFIMAMGMAFMLMLDGGGDGGGDDVFRKKREASGAKSELNKAESALKKGNE